MKTQRFIRNLGCYIVQEKIKINEQKYPVEKAKGRDEISCQTN